MKPEADGQEAVIFHTFGAAHRYTGMLQAARFSCQRAVRELIRFSHSR